MIRTAVLFVTTFLLVSGSPLAIIVYADDIPSPTSTTTQDTTSSPTLAPAPPKPTYTYNSATGHWDSNVWQYDQATHTYMPVPQPVTPQATPATPP
jgi:hypothetical protein